MCLKNIRTSDRMSSLTVTSIGLKRENEEERIVGPETNVIEILLPLCLKLFHI